MNWSTNQSAPLSNQCIFFSASQALPEYQQSCTNNAIANSGREKGRGAGVQDEPSHLRPGLGWLIWMLPLSCPAACILPNQDQTDSGIVKNSGNITQSETRWLTLLEKHSTTERLFSTAKLRQICSSTFHHYFLCCGATSTKSGQKV